MNLKINFAVCHHFLPCAMASHTAKLLFFAVCLSTWHTAKLALFAVCLTMWHTANSPRGILGRRGNFILPWGPDKTHGNGFAVCPKKGTRQTPCMPAELCRALFTVCNTWQIFCRVFLGTVSRSVWNIYSLFEIKVVATNWSRSLKFDSHALICNCNAYCYDLRTENSFAVTFCRAIFLLKPRQLGQEPTISVTEFRAWCIKDFRNFK